MEQEKRGKLIMLAAHIEQLLTEMLIACRELTNDNNSSEEAKAIKREIDRIRLGIRGTETLIKKL